MIPATLFCTKGTAGRRSAMGSYKCCAQNFGDHARHSSSLSRGVCVALRQVGNLGMKMGTNTQRHRQTISARRKSAYFIGAGTSIEAFRSVLRDLPTRGERAGIWLSLTVEAGPPPSARLAGFRPVRPLCRMPVFHQTCRLKQAP